MSTQRIDNEDGTQQTDENQGTQRIDDAQGTQRLDDAQGTQRLDDAQGTQRLDDAQGTQRLDDTQGTQRLDDDSTQRLDDDSSGSADYQMPVQEAIADGKKTGEIFFKGQDIVLNGKDYHIENTISQNSGEAVIYLISANGKSYVLKYYKLGLHYKDNVLSAIKNNPNDKIIKLIEYGNRNSQDYEIMEFAQGGSIDAFLKSNGPVRDAVKLKTFVGQINEGLFFLHNKLRMIYQDLKPDNIYFLDKEKSKLVLADFGISNIMEAGTNEARVEANVTPAYAAPELSRTGNEKEVIVGPPVDYFALGVTIYHIWLGEIPFKDIPRRNKDIKNNDVKLPQDMSVELQKLVLGLINQSENDRWGYNEINRWIAGEDVQIKSIKIIYERQNWNNKESFGTPEELAELLDRDHNEGIRRLYTGVSILNWLTNAKDTTMADNISEIISNHQSDRESGLYKTIYTLDSTRPFISHGGKKCFNPEDIANALMIESIHYKKELKKKDARLYQYLEIAGDSENVKGKTIADLFHKYFTDYSEKHAFNLCYLLLMDGGRSINIGSKNYHGINEIADEKDTNQKALVESGVLEKDSLFNVWLSNQYAEFYDSTDGFTKNSATNKFFILGKIPFLSYKKLHKDDWQKSSLIDLVDIIHNNSGRHDLFDTYVAQGLPFSGHSQKLNWAPTPVQYLVKFFDSIVPDQKTGLELLRFLHEKGADINEASGDGSLPLITAILNRNIPLTKLLLELGADPDKEYRHAPIMWALERIDKKDNEDDRITLANLLLDYKVKLNIKKNNITPLIYSITELETSGKINLISRMMDNKADINLADDDGVSPLTHAVAAQSQFHNKNDSNGEAHAYKVIELLLKKGARPNVLNKKGYWSPLMRAAEGGLVDAIKLLIKNGAVKDFPDSGGDTAFIYAKRKNQHSAADLLKPGADFKLKVFLFRLAKVAFSAFSIIWVLLAFDVLTRGISLLNLDLIALIIVSVFLPHLLIAGIGVATGGVKGFFGNIFDSAEKAFCYIIFTPLAFPLITAGLQFLTKYLPESARLSLLSPVNAMTSSGSPVAMFLIFFLPLAAIVVGKIVYDGVTFNFAKMLKHYRNYYKF